MNDFTPAEEYCHCGDLRDFPHKCGEDKPVFKASGKTTITLPLDVPMGFTMEIPASQTGWIIVVPAYQQIRRKE